MLCSDACITWKIDFFWGGLICMFIEVWFGLLSQLLSPQCYHVQKGICVSVNVKIKLLLSFIFLTENNGLFCKSISEMECFHCLSELLL